ncbi:hypothetical protein OBBRIDRAFT_793891 [Obba rivulosa]|uniref:G domain-containing protein n=1 Tax=Obba rivulosa TaxID=1052685 RepID=A0A8E2DK90_9APHY|nr:hypothetical protein OBBRIDRAFT_793891 [Obba rivulosa]
MYSTDVARCASPDSFGTAKSEHRSSRRQATGDNDVIIAVMGPDDMGKSKLIELLTNFPSGSEPIPGFHSVEPRSPNAFILDGRVVQLVYVPSFVERPADDTDILRGLASFLVSEQRHGRKLSGILYTQRISDTRLTHARRQLTMLQKICGRDSYENVVIATTHWDEVDIKTGAERQETHTSVFKSVLDEGAEIMRHDNGLESAEDIVRHFLRKHPKSIQIQRELVEQEKSLSETEAGQEVLRVLEEERRYQENEMQTLWKRIEKADEESNEVLLDTLQRRVQNIQSEITRLKDADKSLAEFRASTVIAEAYRPSLDALTSTFEGDIQPKSPSLDDPTSSPPSRKFRLRSMFNLRALPGLRRLFRVRLAGR